ncbi:DinB family protein [Deinococcus aquiradiocola]|uniref:Damage-inducible protein DinB n=1 Tax=Deinococcus aquiradiocola TaxID=393059 RepID=A0A917PP37_9DEIO|nr:DinB family protein [Deinococcus aquiradiocola]GGJ86395.1 damage-inducible protein DinB [Deinococcus aquiradiocola]
MNVPDYYDYLCAAREQLWNFLRALPADDLNRDLIEGERFRNIKDLLLHVMDFEDHWVHGVARDVRGYHAQDFRHEWSVPNASQYDLNWILEYSRSVQAETLKFLASGPDLSADVPLIKDDPGESTVTLDQLMWNVMTHEVRHTAQIVLLIRMLGHTPPWLDYLRFARPHSPA